jgi:Putative beta barrel porin-7 (BBP7)
VALPGIASGTITISTQRTVYGGDLNFRYHQWNDENSRIHLLLGGRFLFLDEGLNISMFSQDLPGLGVAGNSFYLTENFNTQSHFYGPQVGATYDFKLGPLVLELTGKFAVGAVQQNVHTSATTRILEPNGIVTSGVDSALYVQPGNAGHFSRTRFAFVPEGHASMSFDFNEHVRLTVGYSYLYLSSAIRPGDQVNRNVNVQPVGAGFTIPPSAPPPDFHSSGFWAQGLDVGVRFSF